jgi:HK97 family phage prohead protease
VAIPSGGVIDADDAGRFRWRAGKWVEIETKAVLGVQNREWKGIRGVGAVLETGLSESHAAAKAERRAQAERVTARADQRLDDRISRRSLKASQLAGKSIVAAYQERPAATVGEVGQERPTGGLYITGYATTWAEDRDGDTVAPDAFDNPSLTSYLEDNPVLLLDHQRNQIMGSITDAQTDDVGLHVEAFIPKPGPDEEPWKVTAFNDIKRGLRRGLSVGGIFHRSTDAPALVSSIDIYEVSLVSIPANADALFDATVSDQDSTSPTVSQAAPSADRVIEPPALNPPRFPGFLAPQGAIDFAGIESRNRIAGLIAAAFEELRRG